MIILIFEFRRINGWVRRFKREREMSFSKKNMFKSINRVEIVNQIVKNLIHFGFIEVIIVAIVFVR